MADHEEGNARQRSSDRGQASGEPRNAASGEWVVEVETVTEELKNESRVVASTGFVAVWRSITFGSGLNSFKVYIVGQILFFIFGWRIAPTFINPLANGLSYFVLWTACALWLIRFWNVIHKCDSDSDQDQRIYRWNMAGFVLSMLATALLQAFIVDFGRQPVGPR
jgi:hypothetical protein